MAERTDYDRLAPDYDRRYQTNRYDGIDSQLALLSDAQYAACLARIRSEATAAEARGESLRLFSDLYLYASFAALA